MPDPGLGDDLAKLPFGAGSPAETAGQPSGLAQVAGGMYASLGELAKSLFGQSESLRAGGPYNAAPAVQTVLGAMGGPLVGATKAAGEAVLGSGPIIKAFHSSPHDFTKFDTSKIGTGEGAQMYGHGLYFAENPAVSGQGGEYWRQFRGRFSPDEQKAAAQLWKHGFDRDAAIAATQANLDEIVDHLKYARFSDPVQGAADRASYEKMLAQRQAQLDLLTSGRPVGPRTYEVDIDADPAQMLDWDKSVGQQTPDVQSAIERVLGKTASSRTTVSPDQPARAFYHDIAGGRFVPDPRDPFGLSGRSVIDPAAASTELREAGIPGIKYLDEGSRTLPSANQFRVGQPNMDTTSLFRRGDQGWYVTAQPGVVRGAAQYGPFKSEAEATAYRAAEPWRTNNYVVFDPGIVDIRKVYGAGSDAGLGNALATSMMSRHLDQFAPPQQPVTRENLT